MVDVFEHPVLQRTAARDVIPRRQVLDVLAQPDSPGVRADGDAELPGHQYDRQALVHAAQAAGVDLAELDRPGLQELLEDNPVRAVLPGRDADAERVDRAGDRRMA